MSTLPTLPTTQLWTSDAGACAADVAAASDDDSENSALDCCMWCECDQADSRRLRRPRRLCGDDDDAVAAADDEDDYVQIRNATVALAAVVDLKWLLKIAASILHCRSRSTSPNYPFLNTILNTFKYI